MEGDRLEYGVVGTLLGPEGTGRPPGSRGVGVGLGRAGLYLIPLCLLWECMGWWGRVAGFWLYVENCTVDASIF